MTALAEITDTEVARPLSVLTPLIKEQIELGDLAAAEAGMPYYRKAGGLMLEAKPEIVSKRGAQAFYDFCEDVSKKSYRQCQEYFRAYREEVAALEYARKKGKSREYARGRMSNTMDELRGATSVGRVFREWTAPVDHLADIARKQQAKAAEDRATEQKRKQELARKLIDIGFKVLAKELHPDKMGGSKDAMVRLNEVRARLTQVYG